MADNIEVFPKYSHDLLEQLDDTIEYPKLPITPAGLENLDEGRLRRLAWQAGARYIVDLLLAWEKEWNEGEDTTSEDGLDDPYGAIFGPDGQPHPAMASMSLASAFSSESDEDDGGLV